MGRSSLILIIASALLIALGMVMIFNTTASEVLDKASGESLHAPFLKQIFYACVGIFSGLAIYGFGYKNIIRISPFLLFFSSLLLILVFIPKIGHEVNGAKRWINLFGLTFQPSEMVKYLIPVYFIFRVLSKEGAMDLYSFYKIIFVTSIPLALILIEPDNGTTFIILVTMTILFVLTRIKWTYFALPLILLVLIGGFVAYQMPHVPDRIRVYLNPELDLRGKGHQPYQAKIASGSGRLFGKGAGESLQKLNYLPEARSDYIAAIYAEEFGFCGMALLIAIYMFIAYAGFHIAFHSNDVAGFYLAAIMTFLISFQTFLNLGVVSGLLPSKGTTLPFFSQGGTALIVNIIAIFLLLNVARESKRRAVI